MKIAQCGDEMTYPLDFGTVLTISALGLCLATQQSTKIIVFSSLFLLEPIIRHLDRHLPIFGVHRSRLRYYDARWVTLPNLSFLIRNRRSTVPGPTPSALLALPLTRFCGEPTKMSNVFAAAREVMRSLRTASMASAARSGPNLADRPKR